MFSRRTVRGVSRSSEDFGVVWRPAQVSGLPLIVVFSAKPSAMGWLASSLAAGLPAVVAVVDVASAGDAIPSADDAVTSAARLAASLAADPARLGVVAEGRTAAIALQLAASRSMAGPNGPSRTPVSRLALIAPTFDDEVWPAGATIPSGFPPTLLQFARDGGAAAGCAALAAQLAAAGVAVRATDYQSPRDGWATRSRAVRQSQRGADDLQAFFARGFGSASTFHVIPGWDLH